MAKDKFGNFGGEYVDQGKFNDIMTNSTPEDKVKLSEVHKSINRLASQLDKNQSNFTKEMKGISGSISTSSKQQQKILNQMKMRELSSSKDIRAVEKSVNVVLGKLGYVVDAVGRNAKKILIDTARATKEHIKEYGRALSGDFAINKANFVASALAKASPIFGYFAGKFFETTVFKHFTELIREKLGAAVSYVGNKFRDIWERGKESIKAWWRDPKKWKRIYDATATILKFPFKMLGKTLAHLWNGVKFIAKLPFKAIGLAFKGLVLTLKGIAKLPGLIFKTALGIIKAPFKMIGGAFGAFKEGYKSVGRKKQEKSREKYIKMQEEYEGNIPSLQKGGYIKKEGLAHIHGAEVVSPFGKLKDAFKRAIAPLTGSVVIELRKLRYATVGIGRDVSATFAASIMRVPLFKGLVSTFQTMKGAYEVYKFWFGKRNRYTNLLSRSSNPQARAADNIGVLYTGMMIKMDTLIANVQLLVERFGGKPFEESMAWKRAATWTRFEKVTSLYKNMGGISGIAKTGMETLKGLFSGKKAIAKDNYEKGKTTVIDSYEKGKENIAEKGGLKEIISTSIKEGGAVIIKQGGAVITIVDEKTGLGIHEKYDKATKAVQEKYANSEIKPALEELKAEAKSQKEKVKGRIKGSKILGKIKGSSWYSAVSSKLAEEKGAFNVGGSTAGEKLKSYGTRLRGIFSSKKKQAEEIQESFFKRGLNYFNKKIAEVKETKSYRKREEKIAKKIQKATEGTDEKLSLGRQLMKKSFGKIATFLWLGFGLIKNIIGGLIKLPFKGLWKLLEGIGSLTIGGIFKKGWEVILKVGKFLFRPLAPLLQFFKKIPWTKQFSISKIFGEMFKKGAGGIGGFFKNVKGVFKAEGLLKALGKLTGLSAIGKFTMNNPLLRKLPVIGQIIGWFDILTDSVKGLFKTREWFGKKEGEKVSWSERINSMLGAALGGTEVGWKGAKSGALKGLAAGMAIGSIVPGIGTAIGGAIGVIAGGLMGAIGGKNIAKGLEIIWSEVKSLVKSSMAMVKYPFVLLGGLAERAKNWISDKYKSINEKVSEWLGTKLDPLWKAIDPLVTIIEKFVGGVVGVLQGIVNVVLHPVKWLKGIMDKIGSWTTENVDVVASRQKEIHAEREAALKGMTETGREFASGISENQRIEEQARKVKADADKKVQAREEAKKKPGFFKRLFGRGSTETPIQSKTSGYTPSKVSGDVKERYQNVKPHLMEASSATGVPFNILTQVAGVESSFKPNAAAGTSSASGIFQFIDGTWRKITTEKGGKYGITPSTSKNDPRASSIMGAEYAKENIQRLSSITSSPSATDVYLSHFLGGGGGPRFSKAYYNNPNDDARKYASSSQISANPSIFKYGATVKDVYEGFSAKLNKFSPNNLEGDVPTAATGGYIPKSGLAYLHSGEAVLPASIVRPMLPQGMKTSDVLGKQQDTQSSLINTLFSGLSDQFQEGNKVTSAAIIDASKRIVSYSSSNSGGGGGGGMRGQDNINDQERYDLSMLISANL
jgi:soluble lytic murein transglycosylase-like protein